MAYIFPVHLLNPARITARPVESVLSGGVALSGEEDVIPTDGGGRWEVVVEDINLRTPRQIRLWNAWEAHLARGATDCLVPLLSLSYANRPMLGKRPLPVSGLVYDDDFWPTSVAYSSPQIVASVGAAASLRATTLQIVVTKGAQLEGGEVFSIGTRGYTIERRTAADTYTIWPPLREAVSAGAAVEFDWPVVKCRSAPGESFAAPITYGRRSGDLAIRFLENAS